VSRLIGQDPTRMPDVILSGPDVPLNQEVKERFFGADVPEVAAAHRAALHG
jgi:hypothetical protein